MKVAYDGYGDSGQIGDIEFFGKDDVAIDIRDAALHTAIVDFLFDNLPGGWEDDVGSTGEVVIDVANKVAHCEHQERVEDYIDHSFDVEG